MKEAFLDIKTFAFASEKKQKIKTKQNKTQTTKIRNIMQSLSTFIRISGLIPEAKKPALIYNWENVIAYWDKFKQNEV